MSTLKDVLCLLAIIVAYGIAGRMDYDDALMLDEAQHQPLQAAQADCPAPNALAFVPNADDGPPDAVPCPAADE